MGIAPVLLLELYFGKIVGFCTGTPPSDTMQNANVCPERQTENRQMDRQKNIGYWQCIRSELIVIGIIA